MAGMGRLDGNDLENYGLKGLDIAFLMSFWIAQMVLQCPFS